MSRVETCRGQYPQMTDISAPLRELARGRAVMEWEQFPPATKDRYLFIAALFPGHQVYAVGSRVRGEHMDRDDGPEVQAARALAKRRSRFSDYDFVVATDAEPIGPLPDWADRIPAYCSVGRRIPVPVNR